MKIKLSFILQIAALILTFHSFAFPQSFQNLKINQIEDTVKIAYDITGGKENDLYKVDLEVSSDGGKSFSIIPKTVYGDCSYGVSRGLNKVISWEPLKDPVELAGDNFIVQLKGKVLGTTAEVEFVSVPGGEFEMGDQFEEGPGNEINKHLVRLSDFSIGKFEVTNFQYAKFLEKYGSNKVKSGEFAGEVMIYPLDGGLKFFQGQWKPDAGFEFNPVIGVTWYGADEFCKFFGYRLSTEAEWEYAAREKGGKVRFGNGHDFAASTQINFNANTDKSLIYAEKGESRNKTVSVGGFAPNKLGIFQMSGNVWEWCQDWYKGNYYFNCKKDNPSGPVFGHYKVIRGGAFSSSANGLRNTARCFLTPYLYNTDVGFRVLKPVH
jgi:formylglycine-generating enzyme required for sulfatase activity